MDFDVIEALEAVRDTPMVVVHRDGLIVLPHPRAITPEEIMLILHAGTLRELPQDMPLWKMNAAAEQWRAHHDLPNFDGLRRLLYLVQKYRNEIEYDLQQHLGVQLAVLFRNREWRRLLNLIDHLPRNSWYTEVVGNDEEHAEMLAKAIAARGDEDPADQSPPMRGWTQEAALLRDVLDAVRNVSYTVQAVQGGKASPPNPAPSPRTALTVATERARYDRKKTKHKALVARMLPHKAAKAPE